MKVIYQKSGCCIDAEQLIIPNVQQQEDVEMSTKQSMNDNNDEEKLFENIESQLIGTTVCVYFEARTKSGSCGVSGWKNQSTMTIASNYSEFPWWWKGQ